MITKQVQQSIKTGTLASRIANTRRAVQEAKQIFEKELGPDFERIVRSFEQLQRNIIFTFNKPRFFDPAGRSFRDVESMSARRGIGTPYGGRYVGGSRVEFDKHGIAGYPIYDVKALAREVQKLMSIKGIQESFKVDVPTTLQKTINKIETEFLKKDIPLLRIGDNIKVGVKIIEGSKERVQFYEGTIIARKNSSINTTITVRKTLQGIGIERIFLIHSPKIDSITVLRSSKVRRSKLYYLRNLKGKASRLKQTFK